MTGACESLSQTPSWLKKKRPREDFITCSFGSASLSRPPPPRKEQKMTHWRSVSNMGEGLQLPLGLAGVLKWPKIIYLGQG